MAEYLLPDSASAFIAHYSFFLKNSVSYLDVQFSDRLLLPEHRTIITTREQFWKRMVPQSYLFDILNIDFSEIVKNKTEVSKPHPFRFYANCAMSDFKYISERFARNALIPFVEQSFQRENNQMKIFKWFLNFQNLSSYEQRNMLPGCLNQLGNKFLDYLYLHCKDSNLIHQFLRMYGLETWLMKDHIPEKVEYLLYHARQSTYDLDLEFRDRTIDYINACILYLTLENIGPLLKYKNQPYLCEIDFSHLEYLIGMERPLRFKIQYRGSKRRNYLQLQILWIFLNRDHPDAHESLRLLWNSIPDAFVTFNEMTAMYGKMLSSMEVSDLYDFYAESVGKNTSYLETRSLQHFCRTTIRRSLYDNKVWFPEGILQIGLPSAIQSILNLQSIG